MNVTRIIDLSSADVPAEAKAALAWNHKLCKSEFTPPVEGEIRADGSVNAFISADNKAVLFFDDCAKNGRHGRIIDDEVTFHPFGPELVMVQAKAYIYVDDVLKGSAVAGQVFAIGDKDTMDRVVQYASGLAKSRALSNAGYGVVSNITIPVPNNVTPTTAPVGQQEETPLPFRTDNLPQPQAGNGQMYGNPVPQPVAPAPQQVMQNLNDPVARAKNVLWPKYKKSMGELLMSGDGLKAIVWAAEKMSQNNEIKQAALVLYPEACRILGVAPKTVA